MAKLGVRGGVLITRPPFRDNDTLISLELACLRIDISPNSGSTILVIIYFVFELLLGDRPNTDLRSAGFVFLDDKYLRIVLTWVLYV